MDLIEARINYNNARAKVNENYRLNITEEISEEAKTDIKTLNKRLEEYNAIIEEKCHDILENSTDGYELILAFVEAMIRREQEEENNHYTLSIDGSIANLFTCLNKIFVKWGFKMSESPIFMCYSGRQYNDQLFKNLIEEMGYSAVLLNLADIDSYAGFLIYYSYDVIKFLNIFELLKDIKKSLIDMKTNDNPIFEVLDDFISTTVDEYWNKVGFDKMEI